MPQTVTPTVTRHKQLKYGRGLEAGYSVRLSNDLIFDNFYHKISASFVSTDTKVAYACYSALRKMTVKHRWVLALLDFSGKDVAETTEPDCSSHNSTSISFCTEEDIILMSNPLECLSEMITTLPLSIQMSFTIMQILFLRNLTFPTLGRKTKGFHHSDFLFKVS